jgi:hypothetical protein
MLVALHTTRRYQLVPSSCNPHASTVSAYGRHIIHLVLRTEVLIRVLLNMFTPIIESCVYTYDDSSSHVECGSSAVNNILFYADVCVLAKSADYRRHGCVYQLGSH